MDNPIAAFANDPIIAIGNIIATSYLVPLLLFITSYWRKSPWWKTDLGVALMAQKIAFLSIFILLDIGYFAHDWSGRAAIRLVLFGVVGISLWLDQLNLTRYQRKYYHNRKLTPRPSVWRIVKAQFTGEEL